MATETNQLPPCPLPDCEGEHHHFHDIEAYTAEEDKYHDCATHARNGYRCYSQHRPQSPQWQPIELDQIRAGMRVRATFTWDDRITTHTGVTHHTNKYGNWLTERGWSLTSCWPNPTIYEVDPATIPDPDADLIEKLAGLLDLTDSEDAREVIAAVRAHDEAVTGDE